MPEVVETGDTPLLEGVSLYEPDDPIVPAAAGDEVKQGEVHLGDSNAVLGPTAGELRANGYEVQPADAPDDARGFVAIADSPVPEGKVNLYVEEPPYPGGPAPEEPTVSLVEPEPPVAVSSPTSEQHGARTDEEREAADQLAEEQAETADPNYQLGFQAYVNAEPRSNNPYDGRKLEGKAWARGWSTAQEQGAPLAPDAPEPSPEDPDAGPPVEGA